jgi:rubrerythrin
MAMEFNADMVLEMAEQIERNGAAFYRTAAKHAAEDSVRELLLQLAVMEVEHERTFAALRSELTQDERTPTVFDPDNEIGLYLRAFADGQVFDVRADPAAALTGEETASCILHTAIGMEKDSIVLYLGIRETMPERLGKERLDEIIRQEMGHIAILSRELAAAQR